MDYLFSLGLTLKKIVELTTSIFKICHCYLISQLNYFYSWFYYPSYCYNNIDSKIDKKSSWVNQWSSWINLAFFSVQFS